MPMHLPAPRTLLSGCLGLALAVPTAALIAPAAQAATDGSGVVISEVYGGGGNSGAAYTQDFVELYNPTAAAVSLDGTSVQYRSSGSSNPPSGVVALSG